MNCVTWFNMAYPGEIIAHYPSGGYRTKAEAGIFKAMGVNKSFPDIMILAKRLCFGGLYIELKAKGKEPDESQLNYIDKLKRKGYFATWTDDIDKFMGIVRHYMNLKEV